MAIRVTAGEAQQCPLRYNNGMHWIYFSPHFDDIALSCGGLVWEQAHAGNLVAIWTICAGAIPPGELSPIAMELHTRWKADQDAPARRRLEDLASCRLLGAGTHYFDIPDCIYRRHPQTGEFMYPTDESITGRLHPGDTRLITSLRKGIKKQLPADRVIVSPLRLGNHVDHQLTHLALEGLRSNSWYYEDYPYVLYNKGQLDELASKGWTSHVFPISGQALVAWQDSVAAHTSQVSTFWSSENEMQQAIADHLGSNGGIRLWQKPAG